MVTARGWVAIAGAAVLAGACSAAAPSASGAAKPSPLPREIGVWAFAPPDATAGVVIHAPALRSVDAALATLADSLADHPKLRPGVERLIGTAAGGEPGGLPGPPLGTMAGHRDFAAFFVGLDLAPVVVVNADPDAVRDWRCTERHGDTVCARRDPGATAVSEDEPLSALARTTAELPGDRRGPIEVVVLMQAIRLTDDQRRILDMVVRDPGTWTATCALGDGVATCRAHLTGAVPWHPFADDLRPVELAPDLNRGAVAVTRARLEPQRLLGSVLDLPTFPLAPGVDLRRDLYEQLDGRIAIATAGGAIAGGTVVAGLTDSRGPRRVVAALCMMARLSGVARVEPISDGCVLRVRPPGENALEQLLVNEGAEVLRASIAVRDDALWLELGDQSMAATGPRSRADAERLPTALPAQLVMWARSFDPLAGLAPPLRKRFEQALVHELDRERFAGLRWLATHVAEAWLALRVDERAVVIDAQVVTFAADPPAVYRAYRAAVARDIDGDHDGYRAQLAAIAEAHPRTLAGQQARLVASGVPALGPAGIVALTLLLL